MSFLSRLFKKSLPETLEHKITRLNLQPQEQLLHTALESQEEQLRIIAIGKLNYSIDLVKIATSNQYPKQIITIARKRIGELLDNSSVSLELLSNDVSDKTVLLDLCCYSQTSGSTLVEQLSDEIVLLELAQSGATTQIRQAAAEKISTRDILNDLAKIAKNKDKAVFKIVKNKLDIFKQSDAEEAELDSKLDAFCKQLELLVKRDVDDIYLARKKQIEEGWSALSQHSKDETKLRFEQALKMCQEKIDQLLKIEQDRIDQENADKEAKKDIHSSLIKLQEFISRIYNHSNPNELQAELVEIESVQKSALDEARSRGLSIKKEHQKAEDLVKSARSLLEKLIQAGPIATLIEKLKQSDDNAGKTINQEINSLLAHAKSLQDIPTPEIVQQTKDFLTHWSQQFKQKAEESKEKIKETSELIRKTDWAISKGYVGRARAIFSDLEQAIQQLEQTPSHITSKYEDVKIAMSKLGDWHEFAVTPKKEALVETMQDLIDSPLHPKDLADKIHRLQDSWKELCKGGQNQDEKLWDQFQSASQVAYERCKTYFAEQTKIRDANASARLALLTHLEQYETEYNWASANWKEVEDTLKASRESWQSYWPVPRKQIKELQERFDGILNRIFDMRNAEFDLNKEKKQKVVDESTALLSTDNIQEAIETAKKLQSQWQLIGRCKRKDDQNLWKAFRTNCDAIFEKRNQENEVLKEERQSAKEKAEEILAQLQDILNSSSANFFEARNQCSSLSEQFQAIGELPRDSYKPINELYHKTLEAIENRVSQERLALASRQWANAFEIANSIRIYELKHILGEECAELKNDIESAMANIQKWPNNTLQVLQHRLENIDLLDANTTTTSVELLRILCIRSEILTNNETPENEKAYRMTYQVNQLKDSFGKANSTFDNTNNEMLNEWMTAPAASNEQYPILLKRFTKCWNLNL